MINGKGEGQVQADATSDEAPTEDIDHGDAGDQLLLVALTTTPLLRRSNRDY